MKANAHDTSSLRLPLRIGLAEQVSEAIRSEIRCGRWTTELPSERHLSKKFLVSRPTLRCALHALQSEGLLRIEPGRPGKVITDRGANPTDGRQKQIVLLYYARMKPDLTALATLVGFLQAQLHRCGYGLQLVDSAPPGESDVSLSLSRIDAEYRPAYYLLASVPTEVQRWVMRHRVPGLVLGARAADVDLPAIELDQSATIRHAVGYLARRGHRRIGLLTFPPYAVGVVSGTEAFRVACQEFSGCGVMSQIQTCPARPASLEAAVRRFFRSTAGPSAIIVTDLELAIGLYTILGEMGMRIPRHVSVLSTGFWPVLSFLRPTPACYYYSWENIANRFMRILDAHRRLATWPKTFWKLLPTLREGNSVRDWPQADPS